MKLKTSILILPLMLGAAWSAPAQVATRETEARVAEAAAAAERAQLERARMAARDAQAAEREARRAAESVQRDAERQARLAERAAERAARDAARAARQAQRAPTEQEQLAIAALEGLMAAPPERALPLLQRVLDGAQTELVKSRALFVLGQMDSPEAQQLLLDRARNGSGESRLEAVRMVGIGGNEESLRALVDIYRSGDPEVRDAVRQAYLVSGRKTELAELARAAGDEDEAREAIQALAAMGALEELRSLGDLSQHAGALVHAYAIAGDLESLRGLATGPADGETRIEAVRAIGIVGTPEAGQALLEIYRGSDDADVRRAVLEGLMIQGNEAALLEIYRASSDAQEKQAVLRQLTIVGGDAALEAIDAALQGKTP